MVCIAEVPVISTVLESDLPVIGAAEIEIDGGVIIAQRKPRA